MSRLPTEDPLVLLPGMGCSARLWSGVLPHLGGREIHTPSLTGADLETCVADLLDRLPPRFALAGLSLGGILAMAVVRTAPERVSGLCLMSTNARPPTRAQQTGWRLHAQALDGGRSAREMQAGWLTVLLRASAAPDLVAEVLAMADDVGAAALGDQLRLQAGRIDERPGLRDVRVPTLVIAAAEDALCPVTRHREIVSLVPGSRCVVLRETGHLSPMERPEAVAGELRGWLSRSRCPGDR